MRPVVSCGLLATAVIFSQLNAQDYSAYQSDSFFESNGEVAFESSNYEGRFSGINKDFWKDYSRGGENGAFSQRAVNDNGTDTGLDTTGPVLEYYIFFQNTGTYTIYVRGYGKKSRSDSIHVGINDIPLTTSAGEGISGYPKSFNWLTQSGSPLADTSFTVSNAGVHKFSIWMREDGVAVDDIVISQTSGLSDTQLDSVAYSLRYSDINTPPVAVDDNFSVTEDGLDVQVAVVSNDFDAEGDTLTVSDVTQGTYGAVTYAAGNVIYDLDDTDPIVDALNTGQTLADSFDYTVSDGNGGSDTGTVNVTINGVTDADTTPPSVPANLSWTAFTDQTITFTWDPSADNNPGSITYNVYSDSGSTPLTNVTINGTQAIVDSLAAGTNYGFRVTATDVSSNESAFSTVLNTVTNNPPEFDDVNYSLTRATDVGQSFDIDLDDEIIDADADSIVFDVQGLNGNTIGWLTWDSIEHTLSGTPGIPDVGLLNVTVEADDSFTVTPPEFEYSITVNPNTPSTDEDGDGMDDAWETANGLNPNDSSDALLDDDGDLLTNLQEFLFGSDPNSAVSNDLDSIPDDWEAFYGLDTSPTVDSSLDDLEPDGLTNASEFASATDPNKRDHPDLNLILF
jgi:VCBS repeat-containing protein